MKSYEVIVEGKDIRLKILGPVDETFQFPENLNCENLTIDFDGMTRFVSIGIRAWMIWIKGKKGYQTMRLEHCRTTFIDQVSHVTGMLPPFATVISFYVPFFDESSGEEKEVLIMRGKDFDNDYLNLPKLFNAEGKPLEVDVHPSYFAFLKIKNKIETTSS